MARDLNRWQDRLTQHGFHPGLRLSLPKPVPMTTYLRNITWLLCWVLCINTVTTKTNYAYQTNVNELLTQLESQLRTYSSSEKDAVRQKTLAICSTTIKSLKTSAVGYALTIDLGLASLELLLQNPTLDEDKLRNFEERLRLITPGPHQAALNQLQAQVSECRRLFATNAETLAKARDGITTLRSNCNENFHSQGNPKEITAAFASLYTVAIDPHSLRRLQTAISIPNVQTQYRTRSLEKLGHRNFQFPIQSATCSDQTTIQTEGTAVVSMLPRFSPSSQSIPLSIQVEGRGDLNAIATRSSARVSANLTTAVQGIQSIELHPFSVDRQSPWIDAQVTSQLEAVHLEGHIGRSRLIRNIVGRVIERKLTEQEPQLSRKLEQAISQRAAEEGEKLAFKIDRLLSQSIWARLESVRFSPEVSLTSTSTYLTSRSLYAYPDQLGALEPPPEVPSQLNDQLDWTTHTHESAINNVCSKLRGFNLEEATMRGIWQVQLKLTNAAWDTPQSATIPAMIIFQDVEPIRIEFREHHLKFLLTLQTAKLASTSNSFPPITTTFTYSLASGPKQFQIVRSAFSLPPSLSTIEELAWREVLTRFFPDTLEPIPKFRPSMWENFVSLRYLNAENGWLSVGLYNLPAANQSIKSQDSDEGQQP